MRSMMVSALCVMKLHNHLIIANLLVRTTIIDVDTITSIVADLSSSEEDLAQESVQVFHLQLIHNSAGKTLTLPLYSKADGLFQLTEAVL